MPCRGLPHQRSGAARQPPARPRGPAAALQPMNAAARLPSLARRMAAGAHRGLDDCAIRRFLALRWRACVLVLLPNEALSAGDRLRDEAVDCGLAAGGGADQDAPQARGHAPVVLMTSVQTHCRARHGAHGAQQHRQQAELVCAQLLGHTGQQNGHIGGHNVPNGRLRGAHEFCSTFDLGPLRRAFIAPAKAAKCHG